MKTCRKIVFNLNSKYLYKQQNCNSCITSSVIMGFTL